MNFSTVIKLAVIFLMHLSLTGCPFFDDQQEKDDLSQTKKKNENNLFDTDFRPNLKIDLNESDWDKIRFEGRKLGTLVGGCNTFDEYSQVRSTVTINDIKFPNVELRKKGGLGSLSFLRPSLKIDLGSGFGNDNRSFSGQRRLTLNNNHQDPSNIEQCLAYELFARANMIAPRCNLATLEINGVDKGFFTLLEPLDRDFLIRNFESAEGRLYEGSGADFSSQLINQLEIKNAGQNLYPSQFDFVIAALESDDDSIIDNLETVLDLDQFLKFAALEALLGHTDSYTGSQTNYYFYQRPLDQKLIFIPWGMDQVFQDVRVSGNAPANQSVFLRNEILYRIWQIPSIRDRYDQILQDLLDEVWDEIWLTERIQFWRNIVIVDDAKVLTLNTFIQNRRAQIEAEIGTHTRTANQLPDREIDQSERSDCIELPDFILDFAGETSTADDDDFDAIFSFSYELMGETLFIEQSPTEFESGIRTELDLSQTEQPRDIVFIRFWRVQNGNTYWVTLVIPPEIFTPGRHPLHAYDFFGVFGNDLEGFQGFIGDGYLELDEAGLEKGSALIGRIRAKAIVP